MDCRRASTFLSTRLFNPLVKTATNAGLAVPAAKAAVVRFVGTDLLTVRVDFDPERRDEQASPPLDRRAPRYRPPVHSHRLPRCETLSYHPVDDDILYLRELEEAAVMTMLHVVADVRGEWGVFEDGARRPLSLHPSATEAEFVAWVHADDRGSERIVVHDRYGRTRAAVAGHHHSAHKH